MKLCLAHDFFVNGGFSVMLTNSYPTIYNVAILTTDVNRSPRKFLDLSGSAVVKQLPSPTRFLLDNIPPQYCLTHPSVLYSSHDARFSPTSSSPAPLPRQPNRSLNQHANSQQPTAKCCCFGRRPLPRLDLPHFAPSRS